MDKKIKLYEADIHNDIQPRISLGARFAGIEDYVGICKKSNWDTPIIVSVKNNKVIARPIIIDIEENSEYCYTTNIDITSILSSEDIEYLKRIVNQSITTGVPLIELSDKLDIDETTIFKHSVQSIDQRAFKAFCEEKHKNNSITINDFVKKAHENSDIKKVHLDIEKLISEKKQIADSTKGINIFSNVKPITENEIADIYANNGFYNISKEQIADIIKKNNNTLALYLLENFKQRIINDVAAKRIKNNMVTPIDKTVIIEYIKSTGLKFDDVVQQKIITETLQECNDKNMINSLISAKGLTKQFENELNKKLDIAYTIATANVLYQTHKKNTAATLNQNSFKNLNVTENDINPKDFIYISNELSNLTSMIVASNIKMDIVFEMSAQRDKGISPTDITPEFLKSKYNLNDKTAQRLASEINTMVKATIPKKENTNNKTSNSTTITKDKTSVKNNEHKKIKSVRAVKKTNSKKENPNNQQTQAQAQAPKVPQEKIKPKLDYEQEKQKAIQRAKGRYATKSVFYRMFHKNIDYLNRGKNYYNTENMTVEEIDNLYTGKKK